jgi:hypothetical protein
VTVASSIERVRRLGRGRENQTVKAGVANFEAILTAYANKQKLKQIPPRQTLTVA